MNSKSSGLRGEISMLLDILHYYVSHMVYRILARLKEAGYEEEVEYLFERRNFQNLYQFNTMPEVRKTQPLTAKGMPSAPMRLRRFTSFV